MAFSNPEENVRQFGLYPGQIVADLGAGVGRYSVAAAKAVGETGRVYAVEVQKNFLQNIKNAADAEKLSNIEVIWGDIERYGKTKIRDKMVDAVILANVLFQVEDKQGVVDEIKRILKPGGQVLVVDWQDAYGGVGPAPHLVVPYDAARALFEENGFTFVRNIAAGDHHYGFVVQG